jgi:hypothetical protein
MRTALAVVILVGCATPARQVRWPNHRHQEEQRISQLEAELATMATQVAQLRHSQQVLEERLRQIEAPASRPSPTAP